MVDGASPQSDKPAIEHSLVSGLKSVSQFAALIAAAIYTSGFIVVSFYQARLGVVEFTVLRPRIIGAGLGFLFFVTMPLVVTFRWFRLFGFDQLGPEHSSRPLHVVHGQLTNRHLVALDIFNAILFSAAVYIATMFFTVFFFSGQFVQAIDTPQLLAGAISLLIGVFAKPFRRLPVVMTVLLGVVVAGIYVLGAIGGRDSFWLALWFMAVAVLFGLVLKTAEGTTWRGYRYEVYVPLVVGLIILYAEKIYPRLKPEFGGGHPTQVVLYFTDKSGPPLTSNSQLEGKLIDETEQGYYVQPMTSSVVYFVPRATVAAVQFAQEGQPLFERAKRPKG